MSWKGRAISEAIEIKIHYSSAKKAIWTLTSPPCTNACPPHLFCRLIAMRLCGVRDTYLRIVLQIYDGDKVVCHGRLSGARLKISGHFATVVISSHLSSVMHLLWRSVEPNTVSLSLRPLTSPSVSANYHLQDRHDRPAGRPMTISNCWPSRPGADRFDSNSSDWNR